MKKTFNKYTVFIIITVLILVICNLIALRFYSYPDGSNILSIVSIIVSIVLGLVTIFYSFISGKDAHDSLGSVNEKLAKMFEEMAQLNENIKYITKDNDDKDIVAKQKKIDIEFNKIRKSFESYNRVTNIFKI
ncbi:MAG: hypothetical protein LBC85_05970 [Fibromonadaceae bacterium]|jgi:predicted PurR-regulated permease PerM|nr:hypothetical protein [Fibromonadaceae bacterium]